MARGLISLYAMTCRITQVATEEGTLFRLDGRLTAESLGDLEGTCNGAPAPLTLDIGGLLWIDDRAAAYLQQRIADDTVVTNASPFIALRLATRRRSGAHRSQDAVSEQVAGEET